MSTLTLDQFTDQKVVVVVNLDEPNADGQTSVEVEGTCLAGNDLGILIKPKGRTKAELIEKDKIESIDFAPEKARVLKPISLKEVTYGDARKHLADRHGVTLSWVNAEGTTEASALEYHQSLDHSDLGHNHDPKPPKAEASEDED